MVHMNKDLKFDLPLAVVVAGALVAASIYLGAREIAHPGTGTAVPIGQAIPQNQALGQPATGPIKIAPLSAQDHIRGSLSAKALIVEYSDTECPFCKAFQKTLQDIVVKYKGDVAWVYRHFPLDGLHPKARKEAEATECAFEQGGNDAFWKYLDDIYAVTPSNNGLDPAQLPIIAEKVGLDKAKFAACLASGKYAAKIDAQAKDAVAAGGRGTPYSVIVTPKGITPVTGGALPFDAMDALVKSALSGK